MSTGPQRHGGRPGRGRLAALVAASLAIGTLAGVTATTIPAAADERDKPTRAQVDAARGAADAKRRDVTAVQADLALADQRLRESAVAAAQAAEAWNGARYRLSLARRDARRAAARLTRTRRAVERQRAAYGDSLAAGYQLAPELSALEAMTRAEGITEVIERSSTLENASTALDEQYDAFRALVAVSDVAAEEAARTRRRAVALEEDARARSVEAQAASDAAVATAAAIAEEKTRLVAELAQLQDISVDLAERRQAALEQEAMERAAARAQDAARAQQSAQHLPHTSVQPSARRPEQPAASGTAAGPEPAAPEPQEQVGTDPAPDPAPPPPASPPAPSGGAGAAIAYARQQIGEPYVWGAAGPDSWDCSGLTMGAWAAGGRNLPHYSVAQYEQSTPIPPSALQPGDLVFWGSSASPSSIYHVGLYVGGGRMVQAPRTGRDVEETSIYYWIPPTHFARP